MYIVASALVGVEELTKGSMVLAVILLPQYQTIISFAVAYVVAVVTRIIIDAKK